MPPYHITTPRLGLRDWRDADRAPFAALNADADVMRYFPAPLSRADSDALVDRLMAHTAATGHTFYAVDTLHDGAFIGMLGVIWQDGAHMPGNFDFLPTYEIGWRLAKTAWGRGYATEGALACIDYARDVLKAERVQAWTATTNAVSERVMVKAGMRRAGTFEHPAIPEGHPLRSHVRYENLLTDR